MLSSGPLVDQTVAAIFMDFRYWLRRVDFGFAKTSQFFTLAMDSSRVIGLALGGDKHEYGWPIGSQAR